MANENLYRNKRPVNLNLLTIRYPVTAIVSILHRLSGVVLFLGVPFLLWVLQASLASPESFQALKIFLSHSIVKFIVWGFMTALIYHLCAGIRHLIMDFGYAESYQAGKTSALIIIIFTIIYAVILGIYLW